MRTQANGPSCDALAYTSSDSRPTATDASLRVELLTMTEGVMSKTGRSPEKRNHVSRI